MGYLLGVCMGVGKWGGMGRRYGSRTPTCTVAKNDLMYTLVHNGFHVSG